MAVEKGQARSNEETRVWRARKTRGEEEDICVLRWDGNGNGIEEDAEEWTRACCASDDARVHVDGEDFSVLLEGEDALNVEDLCEMFQELRDGAISTEEASTSDDASSTEEASSAEEASSSSEEEEQGQASEEKEDARSEDSIPSVSDDDIRDAGNVDEVSELFSELEQSCTADHEDWLAALDVDDVSAAFTDLLDAEESIAEQDHTTDVALTVTPPRAACQPIRSRVFVPSFTVRMEGRPTCLGADAIDSGAFLTGPPVLSSGASHARAGPMTMPAPLASRETLVGRWKEKRKARVLVPRLPDPSLSQARRECASKRRRVKGRFAADKTAFIAITALQEP